MTMINPTNIRKAAILIRSLDGATAARLLAELSPEEVVAVRQAINRLGEVDNEEEADVAAELRRAGSAAAENRAVAVEIDPSLFQQPDLPRPRPTSVPAQLPPALLDHAHPDDLAPLLAGEHPQTVAVVLSLFEPQRAAQVLQALPTHLQPEILERLAELGETDPESLQVIEREVAAWVARQPLRRSSPSRLTDRVAQILAAANPTARQSWLAQLTSRNRLSMDELRATVPGATQQADKPGDFQLSTLAPIDERSRQAPPPIQQEPTPRSHGALHSPRPVKPPLPVPAAALAGPQIEFARLAGVDAATLTAVFRQVEPHVLQLALAGADDALVDRVASQLSKQAARKFRASLNQLGPTRLSDVTAAQRLVAETATRLLSLQPRRVAR